MAAAAAASSDAAPASTVFGRKRLLHFGQERLCAGICRIADDGDLLRTARYALQGAKQMTKGQRLAGHAFTKHQQDGLGKGVVAFVTS